MAVSIQHLQNELLKLSAQERLHLLHWLIDTLASTSFAPVQDLDKNGSLKNTNKVEVPANPLLQLAGRFAGGPGDTAERAEEILEAEINPVSGLSR